MPRSFVLRPSSKQHECGLVAGLDRITSAPARDRRDPDESEPQDLQSNLSKNRPRQADLQEARGFHKSRRLSLWPRPELWSPREDRPRALPQTYCQMTRGQFLVGSECRFPEINAAH